MISQADYMAHDALGLSALVQRREVSASELLEAAIARAEAVNPRLNAIITPLYERARMRARGPLEGAFAGVPMLIKDLMQELEGVASCEGNVALKRAGIPAAQHAEITRRWLAAGVVVFGTTNTPEFGAKGITEPDAWGPTRNPYQLEHTPGGSSGGSAAAVAAGIVPVAGANDGGGSIRIPAAYTGLFGLKPGRGRNPSGPKRTELMHGAAVNHVLTRSVRDSAAMLDATHGPERGSWSKIAPPARPYSEEVTREPGRLRIAYTSKSFLGTPVDPEAEQAVDDAVTLLRSLGHELEPHELAIDGRALSRDFLRAWFVNVVTSIDDVRERTGCGLDDFELDSLAMRAMGRALSAEQYVQGYHRWNDYLRQLSAFHARYDLLLTPAVAGPAPRVGSVKTPPWLSTLLRQGLRMGMSRLIPLAGSAVEDVAIANLSHVPFTQLANLTGVPAMSVPLHVCKSGLPLGVQFVADHGGEGLLLCLAGQLEQARPWSTVSPL